MEMSESISVLVKRRLPTRICISSIRLFRLLQRFGDFLFGVTFRLTSKVYPLLNICLSFNEKKFL